MILVAGGTGTAGGEIVRLLSSRKVPFRALVRNPSKAGELKTLASEIAVGDLAQPDSLPAALKGITKLMSVPPPVENQVELEGNLVKAAKQAGVQHIVKFSAMTANPNAPQRFPREHGITEQAIQRSGMAWTFLRPTFFMQNMLGLAGMVKAGTIYQPCGKGRAGFVDTADVAAVAVAALTQPAHEGKAYDITGPELLSYDDVARIFSEVLGKTVKYQDVPPAAALESMVQSGMPPWSADGVIELCDHMRAGGFEVLTDVVAKAGGKTPVRLADFIRKHAEVFQR